MFDLFKVKNPTLRKAPTAMSTSVVASISYHPIHKSIIPPASSIAFKALVYYKVRKY